MSAKCVAATALPRTGKKAARAAGKMIVPGGRSPIVPGAKMTGEHEAEVGALMMMAAVATAQAVTRTI
jgi:hypothetical protein